MPNKGEEDTEVDEKEIMLFVFIVVIRQLYLLNFAIYNQATVNF